MEIDAHAVELIVMGLCVPGIGYMVKKIMKHSEDFIREIASDVKMAVNTINQHGTQLQLLEQRLTATELKGATTAEKTREQDILLQQLQVQLATYKSMMDRRKR